MFKDLPFLLNLIPQILSKKPLFIILNSYAIRASYLSLHYALKDVMQGFPGSVQSGELCITEDQKTLDKLAQQFLQDGKVNKLLRNIPNCYKAMPVDTAKFKLSDLPFIGILTN